MPSFAGRAPWWRAIGCGSEGGDERHRGSPIETGNRAGHGFLVTASAIAVIAVAGAVGLAWFNLALIGTSGEGDLSLVTLAPTMIDYAVLGWLILRRRPGHPIGWVFLWTALAVVGVFVGFTFAGGLAAQNGPDDILAGLVGQIAVMLFPVALLLAFPVLSLFFPDGRLPGPRWRWPAIVVLGLAILTEVLLLVTPGQPDSRLARNPLGLPFVPESFREFASLVQVPLILLASVLGIASIAVRLARGREEERRQLAWMLSAVVIEAVLVVPTELGLGGDALSVPASLALALIPAATTVAILRYRLYAIDTLVSRTIVYGSVTAILAGIFAGLNVLSQRIFLIATGQSSDAAVVLTSLVVVTLYTPVHSRVESIVDQVLGHEHRHFGGYRDRLEQLVELLEPAQAAKRLANETVEGLRVVGAAVLDEHGAILATAGTWPVLESTSLSISGAAGLLRQILFGPRPDGRPIDPGALADLAAVGRAASLEAAALPAQPTGQHAAVG